jgi:hypothetical protein
MLVIGSTQKSYSPTTASGYETRNATDNSCNRTPYMWRHHSVIHRLQNSHARWPLPLVGIKMWSHRSGKKGITPLFNIGAKWGWGRFIPENDPLYRRLGGLQERSGRLRKTSSTPEPLSRSKQNLKPLSSHTSHCEDWTVLTGCSHR